MLDAVALVDGGGAVVLVDGHRDTDGAFGVEQSIALIRRDAHVFGNLAELLDNIASIVRARLKLLGSVRTLSAEGRLSAWILLALPFVTGALINIITPQFMAVLWTDPIGLRLVGAALVSMTLGVIWMRKIIQIRV